MALLALQVCAPVCHRLLCTHVLGAIAEASPDPAWVERHFLAEALGMCQDTELVVRCSMCAQLQRIAAAVGPALAGAGPLTELLELLSDEHPGVRSTAFGCAVSMLTCCDETRRREKLEPAICKTVASCVAAMEDNDDLASPLVIHRVAENIAPAFDALRTCGSFDLPARDEYAINGVSVHERFLLALSRCHSVELRRECAKALPAAAAALRAQGATDRLLPCLRGLRDDDDSGVRLEVTLALPAVAMALGTTLAVEQTWPLILWVFEHGEPLLVVPLLRALPALMSVLRVREAPSWHALGVQLLPLLLNLEAPLASHWRWALVLIQGYGALTDCVEPHALSSLVLPALFTHLATRTAAPNRYEAVSVICMQLRRLRTSSQRAEICSRLTRELCCANSYALRINFLHACGLMLDPSPPCGCSHLFFKQHGLHHALLTLASDPVANVRLHLCALLLPLKRTLRLPADADVLQKLHRTAVHLQSDSARDVRRAASLADGSLRQLDILTEAPAFRRWEDEDAARLLEEEELAKAEQDSAAEAKRRAADELTERARANKVAEYVRRSGTEGDAAYFGSRNARNSREAPPGQPGGSTVHLGLRSGVQRRSSRDGVSAALESTVGASGRPLVPRRTSRESSQRGS